VSLRLGIFVALITSAGTCLSAPYMSPVDALPTALPMRPLVIGTLSVRPDFHVPRLLPIAERVAAQLHGVGISGVRVLFAKDVPQMCQQFRAGKVDWVSVTIAASFVLQRDCGGQPVLRALDERGAVYRTLFFTRIDSPINRLDQLIGKRLALRNRGSTSSYVIPKMMLVREGLPMRELRTRHEQNAPDRVNLVLSGSETNSALWVVNGLADVSVANSVDWGDEKLFPSALRAQLRVFRESEPVPLALEMFRGDLPAPMRAALIATLLELHRTADGKKAIETYSGGNRFELIPASLRVTLKAFSKEFDELFALEQQK
jgi:phosphonate transport system substrate-binding protein